MQRLCRAPGVFSLATDRQRLLLPVQGRRPLPCGLADQGIVLQQAGQQCLVLVWRSEALRIVERLAHQRRSGADIAGEVLDFTEQVGPPARTDLVPDSACQLQPTAGMLAGVIKTPAV